MSAALSGPALNDLLQPTAPAALPALQVDPLTGLTTRPSVRATLAAWLATPARSAAALLVLDLDRFQSVNDSAGLATGDGVLSRVAKRLRTAVPPQAEVARTSGDEFAVLLPDGGEAAAVAERLLELIRRPYAVNGHAVTISVSIGVAVAPRDGSDADTLLRAAHIALHQAEADGKNRWRGFEPWMLAQASQRQALEMDLRAALALHQVELRSAVAMEQFELHYQPQVSLPDRRVTGFEALLRWNHPTRGRVPPDAFIALAEEIGLIGLLGHWVLQTACRTAARWPVPPGGRPLEVAVNVSPLQLREGRALVASVQQALKSSGLPAAQLEVEITESALMGDAAETLRAIKALGVRLSLDDFGTGYSSLSQLSMYPFDRVKIDRSFVNGLTAAGPAVPQGRMPAAAQAHWMIQAIASLGAGLGLSTIAEGVETEVQAEVVRRAGVVDIQGYLISRPVPESEVPALIERLSPPTPPLRDDHAA